MRAMWGGSKEERERIVETIISDSSYENKPISFPAGIGTPQIAAGSLIISGTDIKLLESNFDIVTVSYGQAAYGQLGEWAAFLSQGVVGDIHEIAYMLWKAEPSVEKLIASQPIDVPTTYAYITYEELLKDYRSLKLENDYFRKELSTINSSQKLQRYSLFYGFLSILSLFFTNFLNVNLIHPILAYFGFCTSAFFYLMGVLMERQETKKCSGKE